VRGSDTGGAAAAGRVRVGDDHRWGMTGGPHLSVSAGGRRLPVCWAGGRTAGLAACWAARQGGAVGPEGQMGRGAVLAGAAGGCAVLGRSASGCYCSSWATAGLG
jgi:hypothetical protein